MAEKKANAAGRGAAGKSKTSAKQNSKAASKKAAEKKLREEALRRSRKRRRIYSIIMLALGILFTLLAVIPGSMGWNVLYGVLHGLFGFAAFIVGPIMIYSAVVISGNKTDMRIAVSIVKSAVFILILCAAVEIFSVGKVSGSNFGEVVVNLYNDGKAFKGGGFFSVVVGVPLLFLGRLGASVIIVVIALVCVLLMANVSIGDIFSGMGEGVKKIRDKTAQSRKRRREEAELRNEEYRRIEEEKRIERETARQKKMEEEAQAAEERKKEKLRQMRQVLDNISDPEKKITAKDQEPVKSPIDLPEQVDNSEMIREQNEESRDYRKELKKYMEKRHPIMRTPEPPDSSEYEDSDADLVPIIDALDKLNAEKGPARVSKIVDAPKADIISSDVVIEKPDISEFADDISNISDSDEAELAFDPDDLIDEPAERNKSRELPQEVYKPASMGDKRAESTVEYAVSESNSESGRTTLRDVYSLPPMTLLNPAKKPEHSEDIDAEISRSADKLVQTLKSFGVSTTYLGASRGPSVTRYELQPAPGVKLSKIANLADDVALNLAVSGVRIAPVPDKAAVGVEIPNKIRDTVFFSELANTVEFKKTFDKKLLTVLGKNISGETVTCNITKMPHLLIAGTTGSGKSVCVNSIIMSMLMKSSPDEVRLIMVDPKQVEFMMYNGIPHLLIPVVTDPKKAAGALAWAVTEMENRYTLFSENNVRNIDGFNQLAKSDDELKKMPHIVIFIDELADLMMASPKDVEDSIVRLAQKARAAGMHLVIATQKPTVQVVTGLIKGNIPSRIALLVSSNSDSRVILDAGGAEKLLGNGDMLYMPVGVQKPIRLQGCYVSDDEVERVAEFIKQTYTAEYDEGIIAEIERQAENVSSNEKKSAPEEDIDGDSKDEKLDDAIEFVVTAGQASTSMLQRHLKLGYGRAARLVDTMEKMGIVGPLEGSKPRQVLMTKQEWYERSLRK